MNDAVDVHNIDQHSFGTRSRNGDHLVGSGLDSSANPLSPKPKNQKQTTTLYRTVERGVLHAIQNRLHDEWETELASLRIRNLCEAYKRGIL